MKKIFATVALVTLCQLTFAEETTTELNATEPVQPTEISLAAPEQPAAPVSYNDEQPKSEVSLSAGVLPVMSFAHLFADVFTTPIAGECKLSDLNVLSFNASYGYHVVDKVVVGATVGYANVSKKYPQMSSQLQQSFNYVTVMPFVKVNWVNKEHFCFYSRVAVGPAFEIAHEKKMDQVAENNFRTLCLFQVSPAGFEWGGKNFRGFAEAGFGQEGYVQVGFRYRF